MVVEPTGVKVSVKFGDSRSNGSRDAGLPHLVTNDDDDDDDDDAGRLTLCQKGRRWNAVSWANIS